MVRLPFLSGLPLARLTWRQRTLFVALATVSATALLAIVVIGIWHFSQAPFRSWFSFTFVPFLVVVLLGALARAQHRIDVRAGRTATLDNDGSRK